MPATATLATTLAPPANAKVPHAAKSPAPHSTEGPSNISLFLTSLRLLDLDKHPEWPGISRVTFSTKDAQQSQKNRIRCVEWALYRLFEIWDGECTRNKLQPFFPPLEPLQSINLRAALFRCLSELKKDGVFGRDMVLRKTMLDECKGERFEELLAVFSAVVLKKRLLHKDADFTGVVRQLATATSLTIEEQSLLRPLIIAHRASLVNCLRGREEVKERYEDFESLLELKRRQVVRREEELRLSIEEQKSKPIITDEEGRALKRQWQEHWVGDEKFLDMVIDGDVRPGTDELLNERYSLIWEKVEDGKLSEVEDMREKTLLEDLDGRVRDQKLRLERWKAFRGEFSKRVNNERRKSKVIENSGQKKEGFILSFEDHKELVPGPKIALKSMPDAKAHESRGLAEDSGLGHEYKRLLQSMQAELAKVGKSRRNGGSGWRKNRKGNLADLNTRVEMDESMSEISPAVRVSVHQDAEEVSFGETAESPIQVGQPSDIELAQGASSDECESLGSQTATVTAIPNPLPGGSESTILKPPDSSSPQPVEPQKRLKSARLSLLDPEGQELLVEQIVSSVTNCEPSPMKPLPSLAERTRMSMASKSIKAPAAGEQKDLAISHRELSTGNQSSEDPTISLLDRTRKSMSAFPQPPAAKPSTTRSRKSIHPPSRPPKPHTRHTPHPETPSIKPDDLYASDNSIPREELFSQEADYASVFKSRPKIALSPTFSPLGLGGDEEELELPGFDSSMVEEADWEGAESSSPLVRARGRGTGRGW
ncbi:hypothetical protein FGG08_006974 [Glutinoglossum americanum]|uniref:HAUS augmin-like complex subunit 6 N-terminal domain-containing protein n=1 Tax=Glutinoglossum americanum TaxID=1670608 RepID=A0A9P8I086_9PEZI|nr:hypothetical protein FGG08_006974 [Glutinoglossum americanum]